MRYVLHPPAEIWMFRWRSLTKLSLCVGVGVEQTTIIAVQRQHYNQDWSFAYQWLLVMSTQLVGFSLGGIAKRFLVSPPSMSACSCDPSYHSPNDGYLDYSLASKPGHMRSIQHSSLSGLFGISRLGNEPRAVFSLWVSGVFHLVYVRSVLLHHL